MANNLSKYNQKLLAIIGTIILIGIAGLLISGLYFLLNDVFDNNNVYTDNSLRIDETEVDSANTRDQEISFLKPRLIDTLNQIYLIPVSHVNLEEKEAIVDDSYGGYKRAQSSKSSYSRYRGVYNNIIIFDQKKDSKKAIFDDKISINSFEHRLIRDNQYLLIEGSMKDTNGDQRLKDSDLQSFYLYDVRNDILQTVEFSNMGLIDYYLLFDSDEIILRYGLDKDQDGRYDGGLEPTYLKKYSISKNSTDDLIDKTLLKELQIQID